MKRSYFYWCCMILTAVHLLILAGYGMHKEGYHEDEYYSYWSSTGKVELNPRSAYDVRTGYEIQRQFMVREGERFAFSEVIQNQAEDVHPPLYYLALNVIMSLMPEHFYKWFGLGLNMLCSAATLAGILFLLRSLDGRKQYPWAVLLAGIVYAIAPSTVSNVMFIRMYAMSAMWTVWYACLIVRMIRQEECSRKRFALFPLAGAVLCFLAFLTHYFCLLVPFFLTLAYCIRALFRRKGILRMLIYGLSMCGAIGLAVWMYPVSLEHIFHGYRGEAAISTLVNGSFREMCGLFLPVLNRNVYSGVMWLAALLSLSALLFLVIKKKGKRACCCLAAVYFSCIAAVCFLVKTSLFLGDSSCRYFYPVLALLLPLQAYLLCRVASDLPMGKSGGRILGAVLGLLICMPLLAGHLQQKILFLYPEDAEKKALAQEYGAEYPLIVVYSADAAYRSWYIADQVWPFQYVIYSDYAHMLELPEDPLLSEAKGFVVYMDAPAETLETLVARNTWVSGYTLLRKDPFYYVYLVE